MNWKSKAVQNFLNDCKALSRQEPEGKRFLKIGKKRKKETGYLGIYTHFKIPLRLLGQNKQMRT